MSLAYQGITATYNAPVKPEGTVTVTLPESAARKYVTATYGSSSAAAGALRRAIKSALDEADNS